MFEAVECRVNRSFGQIERTAAAAANLLDDRVAMRRAARERGEHNHVEVTFEHFAFHTLKLCLALLGVNSEDHVLGGCKGERGAAASP